MTRTRGRELILRVLTIVLSGSLLLGPLSQWANADEISTALSSLPVCASTYAGAGPNGSADSSTGWHTARSVHCSTSTATMSHCSGCPGTVNPDAGVRAVWYDPQLVTSTQTGYECVRIYVQYAPTTETSPPFAYVGAIMSTGVETPTWGSGLGSSGLKRYTWASPSASGWVEYRLLYQTSTGTFDHIRYGISGGGTYGSGQYNVVDYMMRAQATQAGHVPVGSSGIIRASGLNSGNTYAGGGGDWQDKCENSPALPAGPTSVPLSQYVKNLRVNYGLHVYEITYDWIVSGPLTWTTTASSTTGVGRTGQYNGSETVSANGHVTMAFRCNFGCGSDSLLPPFTLLINDVVGNKVATGTFGTAGTSTVVIPDANIPKIAWVQGCATGATGCPPTEAQPGHLVFRLMPMGASTASVVVCQLTPDTDGCLDGGVNFGVVGAIAETNYDSGLINVPAGDYKISAVNAGGSDATTFTITANGLSGVAGPSQTGVCAPADLGCHINDLGAAIQSGMSRVLGYLFVPSSGSFIAWQIFETRLGTREPLATIGAAKNAVGTFVGALVVVNTTDCQVFDYGNVDIGFLGAGRVIPVSVSICPEQYGGGSPIYQSVRTMAGYAIYLGFAYKTYKGFAPKPVMS